MNTAILCRLFAHPRSRAAGYSIKIIDIIDRPYTSGILVKEEEIEKKFKKAFKRAKDDWFRMDERIASFYMTLLATSLSNEKGYGLLTDMMPNDKLANAVRRDANLKPLHSIYYSREYYPKGSGISRNLAQGTLANLILKNLEIDPNTPVEKIIEFRSEHKKQLGRFRAELGKLTEHIAKEDMYSEKFIQSITDIYTNNVEPSIDDLNDDLKNNKIKFGTTCLFGITSISVSTTHLATALLGLAVPQAIIASAGISLVATPVLYNIKKKDILKKDPYSYVLALKKLN